MRSKQNLNSLSRSTLHWQRDRWPSISSVDTKPQGYMVLTTAKTSFNGSHETPPPLDLACTVPRQSCYSGSVCYRASPDVGGASRPPALDQRAQQCVFSRKYIDKGDV
jgi:hypothetical protein